MGLSSLPSSSNVAACLLLLLSPYHVIKCGLKKYKNIAKNIHFELNVIAEFCTFQKKLIYSIYHKNKLFWDFLIFLKLRNIHAAVFRIY